MTNSNGELLNCILIHEENPNQTIEDIHIRPLRSKFIVTATVDGNVTRQEIPRDVVEDRPALCVCIGDNCNEIDPIGNLCDNCEDTGNIFANNIQNIEDYIEAIQQSKQESETIYYYYYG